MTFVTTLAIRALEKLDAKRRGEPFASSEGVGVGTGLMLVLVLLWLLLVMTVGRYCWDNAAVPLIPALAKSGKNGRMKLLGLSVLASVVLG